MIGLLLAATTGWLWGQGRVDRDIVYSEQNGECVLTGSPTQIVAKRNFAVIWRVANHCGEQITVLVGNFRFNGEPREPMRLTSSATVQPQGAGLISGLIKGDAEPGTYTYDVALEGSAPEDPELVINP